MRNFKRAYLWCSFVAACAFFVPRALLAAEPEPPVIERCNPRTYHIKSTITPLFEGTPADEFYIITALPETSLYQTVSGEKLSRCKIRRFPLDCGRYVFYSARKKFPPLVREFDVTVYEIHTHWDRIKNVPEPSGKQRYFTRNCGDGVVKDHPEVVKVSRELAAKSKNIVEYARLAYLFMMANFKYGRAPDRSLHSIWTSRRGDCGNLSAAYVSLLRARGIPARSVLALRPDDSCHVWAEFFIDGVGWIPVDISADLGRVDFRHFGNYYDNCVVMHKDLYFRVFNGRKKIDLESVQSYCFWFWASHKIGEAKPKMIFRGERIPNPKTR